LFNWTCPIVAYVTDGGVFSVASLIFTTTTFRSWNWIRGQQEWLVLSCEVAAAGYSGTADVLSNCISKWKD
jgi:hypothetical protein